MNVLVRLLACATLFIIPAEAHASDSSPQPTTSPTSSGKSKPSSIPKQDIDQFVKARESILGSIKEFDALAAKSKGSVNRSDEQRMKLLLGEIAQHSKAVHEHVVRLGDPDGESISRQLIIDDDITGKQESVRSTAKLLGSLGDKLGLLEPVVYR